MLIFRLSKMLLIVSLLFSWLVTTAAANPYLSLQGGVGTIESHQNHGPRFSDIDGTAFAAAGGWDFGYFRVEGEYLYTHTDSTVTFPNKKQKNRKFIDNIDEDFIFINALVDIPLYQDLELYAGGGYGFTDWQAMAGLRYHFSNHWSANLGYRFLAVPFNNSKGHTDESHFGMIGVTYRFDLMK